VQIAPGLFLSSFTLTRNNISGNITTRFSWFTVIFKTKKGESQWQAANTGDRAF
jgi:hypothetical protein